MSASGVLISHRFNPGHFSHVIAFEKMLRERGFQVFFRMNERFYSFFEPHLLNGQISLFNFIFRRQSSLCIVLFPSLMALVDVLLVRMFSDSKVVYLYHEPYEGILKYRRAGFGYFQCFRIFCVSLVSRLLVLLSQKVILPSNRAFDALKEAKSQPDKYLKMNLLFSDEAVADHFNGKRHYISYIGTLADDHAFDEFVRFMKSCVERNVLSNLEFLIATRNRIPASFLPDIELCALSGRLKLVVGQPLSNEVINSFYSESIVVWNAYRRSMQSGVLAKSFMFGTPVLISTLMSCEYFRNGHHGFVIDLSSDVTDFISVINSVQEIWSCLSKNCRASYVKFFDYTSHSENFFSFVAV